MGLLETINDFLFRLINEKISEDEKKAKLLTTKVSKFDWKFSASSNLQTNACVKLAEEGQFYEWKVQTMDLKEVAW